MKRNLRGIQTAIRWCKHLRNIILVKKLNQRKIVYEDEKINFIESKFVSISFKKDKKNVDDLKLIVNLEENFKNLLEIRKKKRLSPKVYKGLIEK